MLCHVYLRRLGLDDLKSEEISEKRNKIHRFINLPDLKSDFKGFRDTSWGRKFLYPFQSPQTAILSVIYTVLQVVFVILACHNPFGQ